MKTSAHTITHMCNCQCTTALTLVYTCAPVSTCRCTTANIHNSADTSTSMRMSVHAYAMLQMCKPTLIQSHQCAPVSAGICNAANVQDSAHIVTHMCTLSVQACTMLEMCKTALADAQLQLCKTLLTLVNPCASTNVGICNAANTQISADTFTHVCFYQCGHMQRYRHAN